MLRRCLLACLVACVPFAAFSQAYPERPVKLVVGFPPGTGPDLVARSVTQKLGDGFRGQPLVIDNRVGAGGQIAAQGVAKSPADGYTLLLGEAGSISIAPAVYNKLPYDPEKQLVPVVELARSDYVLVVPTSSPAHDVKGFVASARNTAKRLNFATFGIGTQAYLGAEMLADVAGFKIEPVHYRETGAAITDLITGNVQAAFLTPAMAAAHVGAGKMRALAITAPARSPLLPGVPTFAEAGWPQVDFSAWFTIFAPAGTPAPVIEILNRQLAAAVQHPDVRRVMQEAGFKVTGSTQKDSEKMVKSEAVRWAAIVKEKGFKLD